MFAGVDVGTTTTKAVVIDAEKRVLGRFVRRSGRDLVFSAEEALREALVQARLGAELDPSRRRDRLRAEGRALRP